VVSVADNGEGLAPDLLPRVFDLFVQGARAADRSQGGLGIGLTLVKNLVSLHEGTVTAASAGAGKGSTFTVRIPASEVDPLADDSVTEAPALVDSVRRRVLVVDDNADAAELLADALRKAGHDVRVATDGPAALRELRMFPADVAILDLGLPVMDGYELAARIQTDHAARVPKLVALTGYAQREDRERTHAAGFRVHFVKPVKPAVVLQALDEA